MVMNLGSPATIRAHLTVFSPKRPVLALDQVFYPVIDSLGLRSPINEGPPRWSYAAASETSMSADMIALSFRADIAPTTCITGPGGQFMSCIVETLRMLGISHTQSVRITGDSQLLEAWTGNSRDTYWGLYEQRDRWLGWTGGESTCTACIDSLQPALMKSLSEFFVDADGFTCHAQDSEICVDIPDDPVAVGWIFDSIAWITRTSDFSVFLSPATAS